MLAASQAEALVPGGRTVPGSTLAGDPLTLDLDPLWIELPPLPEVEEGPLPEVDP